MAAPMEQPEGEGKGTGRSLRCSRMATDPGKTGHTEPKSNILYFRWLLLGAIFLSLTPEGRVDLSEALSSAGQSSKCRRRRLAVIASAADAGCSPWFPRGYQIHSSGQRETKPRLRQMFNELFLDSGSLLFPSITKESKPKVPISWVFFPHPQNDSSSSKQAG